MQFRKTNFQFVHISVLHYATFTVHTLGLNSFFLSQNSETLTKNT